MDIRTGRGDDLSSVPTSTRALAGTLGTLQLVGTLPTAQLARPISRRRGPSRLDVLPDQVACKPCQCAEHRKQEMATARGSIKRREQALAVDAVRC